MIRTGLRTGSVAPRPSARGRRRGIMLAAFALSATAFAAAGQAPDKVAAGRTALVEGCSDCHDANVVAGNPRLPSEWDEVMTKMQAYGAIVPPERLEVIRDYLLKTYGKVNINVASATDLASVLDLSPSLAEAIVAYRKDHGDFKSPVDVRNVPGAEAVNLDPRKNRMLVQ